MYERYGGRGEDEGMELMVRKASPAASHILARVAVSCLREQIGPKTLLNGTNIRAFPHFSLNHS